MVLRQLVLPTRLVWFLGLVVATSQQGFHGGLLVGEVASVSDGSARLGGGLPERGELVPGLASAAGHGGVGGLPVVGERLEACLGGLDCGGRAEISATAVLAPPSPARRCPTVTGHRPGRPSPISVVTRLGVDPLREFGDPLPSKA